VDEYPLTAQILCACARKTSEADFPSYSPGPATHARLESLILNSVARVALL